MVDKLNATVSPSSITTETQLMYVETPTTDYLEERFFVPKFSLTPADSLHNELRYSPRAFHPHPTKGTAPMTTDGLALPGQLLTYITGGLSFRKLTILPPAQTPKRQSHATVALPNTSENDDENTQTQPRIRD